MVVDIRGLPFDSGTLGDECLNQGGGWALRRPSSSSRRAIRRPGASLEGRNESPLLPAIRHAGRTSALRLANRRCLWRSWLSPPLVARRVQLQLGRYPLCRCALMCAVSLLGSCVGVGVHGCAFGLPASPRGRVDSGALGTVGRRRNQSAGSRWELEGSVLPGEASAPCRRRDDRRRSSDVARLKERDELG
jgi:hypothetical protein